MQSTRTRLLGLGVLAYLLLIAGCATPITMTEPQLRSAATVGDFVPIDPLPFEAINYVKADGTKVDAAPWPTIPTPVIRTLLPNQEATIVTRKLSTDGSVKYLVASITGEVGSYDVLMDYIQYRVENVVNSSGKIVGLGRVGIGLRIKAKVETKKTGVDLGSLIAIGVAAKLGYLNGKLSVAVLGVYSPDITTLFPTPSDINETSIQKALEALAAIKSKIGDDKTGLTPQVVALKVTDGSALDASTIKDHLQ